MNKRTGGRKSWHISTLFSRALQATSDSNSYWGCIHELRIRGNDLIFEEARNFCHSKKITEKILGIDVLAQLGSPDRPYSEKVLDILLPLLSHETNYRVLNSLLVSIGHQNNSDRIKDVKLISSFAVHISEDVRFGVTSALAKRGDRISVATLIGLMKDEAVVVRDWATFSIGSMIDVDTPAIRNALADRLSDSDNDTRCEALVGLAIRKDKRVLAPLRKELVKPMVDELVIEAAEEYADKSLDSLLERFR
jgi:HEAT repeat protein